MISTVQRIKEYLDFIGLSIRQFEIENGFSNGSFSSQFRNNGSIGVDKVENILRVYKDLNPIWLLTGEGEMLRQSVPVSEDLLEKLAAQEKVIKDKEKIIEGLEFKIATLEKQNGRHDKYESIELEAIATRTKPKLEKEK